MSYVFNPFTGTFEKVGTTAETLDAGSDGIMDLGERTTLDSTIDFGNRVN